MKEKITNSPQETRDLGQRIASNFKGREILALFGELGSGKTTFVQGVASGLGIKQNITSPSFVLMNQYQIPERKIRLCHFDFYRLRKGKNLSPADLTDYLGKKEYICLIEWADRVTELLPKETIKINFNYLDEKKRKIDFSD